jgi:hypothetical protein
MPSNHDLISFANECIAEFITEMVIHALFTTVTMGVVTELEALDRQSVFLTIQIFHVIRTNGLQYPAVAFQYTVHLPDQMIIGGVDPIVVFVPAGIIAESFI